MINEFSLEDLDSLLDLAAAEAAAVDGRPPEWIAHHYGSAAASAAVNQGYQVRPNGNTWTDEELEFLKANSAILGEEEIAAALGRSAYAIHIKRTRLGLESPTRNTIYITAYRAGKALGIDGKVVTRLIIEGRMPGELAPVEGRIVRRIPRTQFYAWAVNPQNWPYFIGSVRNTRRIRDPHLRHLIERQKARWDDEWWTTKQVADYHGVHHQDVNRYLNAGALSGFRWQNWLVLRSVATHPAVRFYKGEHAMTSVQTDRCGTPGGDAFIVLARAVGLPYLTIGRMMNRTKGVDMRLGSLARLGRIPHLIRAYELGVRYHFLDAQPEQMKASSMILYADWRPYAHRFPKLAAACQRFAAGAELTVAEVSLVNSALLAAARWRFGREDELVRWLEKGGRRSIKAAHEAWERLGGSWNAVADQPHQKNFSPQ